MHVAYSAIRQTNSPALNQTLSRYHGYRAACIKHADTIAQIQRYMPGWQPGFDAAADGTTKPSLLTACK